MLGFLNRLLSRSADARGAGAWPGGRPLRFAVYKPTPDLTDVRTIAAVERYFSAEMGVPVTHVIEHRYDAMVDCLVRETVDLAYIGAALFARLHLTRSDLYEPFAALTDGDGNFGYSSILVVRSQTSLRTLADLAGTRIAFVSESSGSGFQAPAHFLRQDGIDWRAHFAGHHFAGSHFDAVRAVLAGTADVAATWFTNTGTSNLAEMANQGELAPDQLRVVWTSPRIPDDCWVAHRAVPASLRGRWLAAVQGMPDRLQRQASVIVQGERYGFRPAGLADYAPIIDLVAGNARAATQS